MTGVGSTLNFYGTQTLDNATIDVGGAGSSAYLNAWDENGAPATLTLGPDVNIVTTVENATATLGGSADATLINKGTITAETNSAIS
jgi:hypothetical protein